MLILSTGHLTKKFLTLKNHLLSKMVVRKAKSEVNDWIITAVSLFILWEILKVTGTKVSRVDL